MLFIIFFVLLVFILFVYLRPVIRQRLGAGHLSSTLLCLSLASLIVVVLSFFGASFSHYRTNETMDVITPGIILSGGAFVFGSVALLFEKLLNRKS